MHEDDLDPDDSSIEFVVIAEPYEQWRYYVGELRRNRFHWDGVPNCLGKDMYPNRIAQQLQLAKTVCSGCPVQFDCLYLSLVGKEEFGVWGGTTQHERAFIITKLNDVLGNFAKWWSSDFTDTFRKTAEQFVVDHNSINDNIS